MTHARTPLRFRTAALGAALLFVGPSPAVNAYVKSKGQARRVVAGASSGGAEASISWVTHTPYLRVVPQPGR